VGSTQTNTTSEETVTVNDFQQVAARYIDTWNESHPALRRAAIEEIWAEDGRYVDPLVDATGRDEIDATIAAVQAKFPSFEFRLLGPVDAHHNQCRFTWELGPKDVEAPVVGFDVVVLSKTGKLQTVLGFLDRVPAS
jgi:SnoaL-like domain